MRETNNSVYKPAEDLWGFNRYDADTGVPLINNRNLDEVTNRRRRE
jgi:hypothetical protein